MSEEKIYGRLLPLPDREPSAEAAFANVHSADIQRMQAEAQFDKGLLSSRELERFMRKIAGRTPVRHMFNPFTGEYRFVPADEWTTSALI